MNRREFILVTSGLGIVGILGYKLKTKPKDSLVEYISSLKGIENIGNSYIAQYQPSKNIMSALKLKLKKFIAEKQATSIEQSIKKSISHDYKHNQLCLIDGWQLSETECLLAANYVTLFNSNIKEQTTQNFNTAKISPFLEIKNWGPKKTLKGKIFNQQSDGHAGLWISVLNPPPNIAVYIDGEVELTYTNEKSITSGIHDLNKLEKFINSVGLHQVYIYDDINNRKQLIGEFEVLPTPIKLVYPNGKTSLSFCPIKAWGPQQTKKDAPFNIQPNGNSAIWIKTECAPASVKVLINKKPIKTTVQPGLITASVPIKELTPFNGAFKVELFDRVTKESIVVGSIKID